MISTPSRSSGRRRPAGTTRGTRSGSACRPRAPRRPHRVDAILDALRADGHELIEATPQPDDALLTPSTTRRWSSSCAPPPSAGPAGPYAGLVGQERVVPYLFPTPAMTAGLPARPAVAIHADAGRFAYDTMTLVGPGTWEAARAAVDCAVQAAELVVRGRGLAYALCRPPGHHATWSRLRRLLLPQQRRGRRGGAARARRPEGRDRRPRRPPRQRHGVDLLRPRRRALRLGARRPGRGLVPARRRVRRRDRSRRRRGRHPQPAAARGHRRRAMAGGRRRARRVGRRRRL